MQSHKSAQKNLPCLNLHHFNLLKDHRATQQCFVLIHFVIAHCIEFNIPTALDK